MKTGIQWLLRTATMVVVVGMGTALSQSAKADKQTHLPTTKMPKQDHHQIDQLEETWRKAIVDGNTKAMEALLADDYMAITASGAVETKGEMLASLRTGRIHISQMQISDRKVRFYGDTAVVTSQADIEGKGAAGEITGSYRYTRVYARDANGAWKIVSFEASKIRDQFAHR